MLGAVGKPAQNKRVLRSSFTAIAILATLLSAAASAHARTVETVAVTPQLTVSVDQSAPQAAPGASVPMNINIANTGATVGITGELGFLGLPFTNSVVKSWWTVLEYQPVGGSWTPLAGVAHVAPGYAPQVSAPLSTGLSATTTPVARFGVTYPTESDKIIGTQVAGFNFAQWKTGFSAQATSAEIMRLLSSAQTSQIRLRTRIEAKQTGLFSTQWIGAQSRTATFTQMLRSQSANAKQVSATATSETGAQSFTQSNTPALAELAPGQSVALAAQVQMPTNSGKQAGESDGDYLARLRGLAARSLATSVSTDFTARGVASAYWWWIGESDPGFELGADRRVSAPDAASDVAVALPIMEIVKSGPPSIDLGQTATYEIGVANTGDADGEAHVGDEVDGMQAATVPGFGVIEPGQARSGSHQITVPASLPNTSLHDRASVTWSDASGNQYGPLSADVTSSVNVDVTAPDAPLIISSVPALTASPTANFEFQGEPGGAFKCSLDAAPETDCISPLSLIEITDGTHSFSVWQVDDAGNVGSASTLVWRVDTHGPQSPQVSGVPAGPTRTTSAQFEFTGEPGGHFECQISAGQWQMCNSPIALSGLEDGSHEIDIRQVDDAGNPGDPAHAQWIVDTVGPAAPQLNSTPTRFSKEATAGFGFAGEPGGTYSCSLDSAPYSTCQNPMSYADLTQNDHEFAVFQTDDAGNPGEVARFTWTIDTTAPPAPQINTAPPSQSASSSATFEFSGEQDASFECSSDGAEFAACDSPVTISGLEDGAHTFGVRQTDAAGNTGSLATHAWSIDTAQPAPPNISASPSSPTTQPDASFEFAGEADAIFECRIDLQDFASCSSPKTYNALSTGDHTFDVHQRDPAGNVSDAATIIWTIELYDPPSDLSETDFTPMADQTEFLYSGENPIQTGVTPGTIKPTQTSVLRGSVKTGDGQPLSGATVTVIDRPEFGQTVTTEDGTFSMAVNGGGDLRVRYELDGYLPVERIVSPNWLDYEVADDAVMTPLSNSVTAVDTSGQRIDAQTVIGDTVTDQDGERTAVMVIPPGTQAVRRLPDGSTEPLSQLSLRQTEYTVGEGGQAAMPAPLPGTSAYTYAMAITADGVPPEQADQIEFSQPVASYVNAVVDMPVGSPVPIGRLDSETGTWERAQNGRVIKLIGMQDGLVQMDIDGSGTPATQEELLALGIGFAEAIAVFYAYGTGDVIWRAPAVQPGGQDYNFMKNVKGAAGPSPQSGPDDPDCESESGGSIIECESQGLREELPIEGTPYTLGYTSKRTAGRSAANTITFTVTGDSVQPTLQRILIDIRVAGRKFEDVLPPGPNQTYTFTWDGRDAYGRDVIGTVPLEFGTGFVYPTKMQPTNEDPAFGRYPVGPAFSDTELIPGRGEAVIWRGTRKTVGAWRAKNSGLGGWSLDIQHRYDPVAQTLMFGNGKQFKAENVNSVVTTVAGICTSCPPGTPRTPSTQWGVVPGYTQEMTVGDDGSTFVAARDTSNSYTLMKFRPDGSYENVTTSRRGPLVDSLDYEERVRIMTDIAAGPDGSVYFIGVNSTLNKARIGRLPKNGPMEWIQPSSGTQRIADGVNLSNLAPLGVGEAAGLDVGPDGSIYLATRPESAVPGSQPRVWRIAPSGEIDAVVGTGEDGDSPDSGFARNAKLSHPTDVAVTDAGELYVSDYGNQRILHVDAAGNLDRVAWPRDEARSWQAVSRIVAGKDGRLAFITMNTMHVWTLELDGSIIDQTPNIPNGSGWVGPGLDNGDGGPAAKAAFGWSRSTALGPDGSLYLGAVAEVRKISPPLPGFTNQDLVIPSPSGDQLYVFDRAGRHLRTLDAKTNAVVHTFTYDPRGLLSTVTDADGDVTAIERDEIGKPTAIRGPFGHSTQMLTDNRGDLRRWTAPSGREHRMDYSPRGLLSAMSDPKGGVSQFTYDRTGRLLRDDDRADGFKTLTRTDKLSGWVDSSTLGEFEVALTTGLGKTTRHNVKQKRGSFGPEQVRTTTDPDGTSVTSTHRNDGSSTTALSDSTTLETQQGADPRFGMKAPYVKSAKLRTPSGLQAEATRTRTAEIGASANLLDLSSQTQTTTINGKTATEIWSKITGFSIPAPSAIDPDNQPAPAERQSSTSPAGRTAKSENDAHGRPQRIEIAPGIEPLGFTYDSHGRITKAAQGSRDVTATYDTAGNLASFTDSLGRVSSYEYDQDGRTIAEELPGARRIEYAYDQNGNVTQITPPSRPVHAFAFDPLDQLTSASAPEAGGQQATTTYTYDADHRPTSATRPNGDQITADYDAAGRLARLTDPDGQSTLTYNATTGKLTGLTSPDNQNLAFTYDGPLLTATNMSGQVQGSTTLSYNNDFQVTRQTTGATTTDYTYDADGLLTAAGDLSITHDPQTGLTTAAGLENTATNVTYNTYGEPTSVASTHAPDATTTNNLYTATYTRDAASRITVKQEIRPSGTTTWAYNYDAAGRLVNVTKNGDQHAAYTYDANGNRTSKTVENQSTYATFDSRDRMNTYGDLDLTYSQNGELTEKRNRVTGETLALSYTTLGDLSSATTPDGEVVNYLLDGFGRRVGKKTDGNLTQGLIYSPEAAGPVAELDAQGNTRSRFIYAGGHAPAYMVKNGTTYRLLPDQLGSVVMVADATTGAIAQEISYGPYGEVLSDSSPGFQPFGYAGGIFDSDTGLTHFGAREYDAELGRWSSSDPIGFGGGDSNLYGYVLGDPVNFVDPSGLYGLKDLKYDAAHLGDTWDAVKGAAKETGQTLGDAATFWNSDCVCDGSFVNDAMENFMATNGSLPGLVAPTGANGVGINMLSEKYGIPTPKNWLLNGGSIMKYQKVLGQAIKGSSAVTGAWVVGTAIGSTIRAKYGPCD